MTVSVRGSLRGRNLKIRAKNHTWGAKATPKWVSGQREPKRPGALETPAGHRNGRSEVGMSPPKAAGTQLASCGAHALPEPQDMNALLTLESRVHPKTRGGRNDLGRRVGVTAEK